MVQPTDAVRPLTGIRADRRHGYKSIEHQASLLRTALGLGPLDRFDARAFFENGLADLTVRCRSGEVELREAVEDCQQEGLTRWDSEAGVMEVVLSSVTYDLLQEDHVRARSTVAHECGHAYLHTDQIIRLAGMNLRSQVAFHRERAGHEACEDTEWQANAFGSSLLMPAAGVVALSAEFGLLSPTLIAAKFGVSVESASYRIGTYERSLGV
jgi:IrrE N-terminal-like domain